jgi:hypothetical protein
MLGLWGFGYPCDRPSLIFTVFSSNSSSPSFHRIHLHRLFIEFPGA